MHTPCKGPSETGTTSLQWTLPNSNIPIWNAFQLLKRGLPPYKGQIGWSQLPSVLYSEVPLYKYTLYKGHDRRNLLIKDRFNGSQMKNFIS